MNDLKSFLLVSYLSMLSSLSFATGMVPETSAVFVNAKDGEGTINVTNTDDNAVLLHTTIENLPEDTEELLFVTSPISRVEAGEKQLVRLVLQSETPLLTQRLKRVIFEGIAQQSEDGVSELKMTIRQNLPVIISPAGLPVNAEPWKLLKWEVKGRTLSVRNESPYVIRLNQQLNLVPTGGQLIFPRSYILPGQFDSLELPVGVLLSAETKVRLQPASLYGYQGVPYDAPLKTQ